MKKSKRVKEDKIRIQAITRKVILKGTKPIMFDRYAGDNQTKLEWWQKIYLDPADGQTMVLPSMNFISFLSAHNTNSAPKRLRDARQFKKIANAFLSFVEIDPFDIPFIRDDKPIVFEKIDASGERDSSSGIYLHRSVARLEKGIPNPKERPILPLPWELRFDLTINENKEFREQELINLIEEGGRAIGLGTYRGVFGKFMIEEWN